MGRRSHPAAVAAILVLAAIQPARAEGELQFTIRPDHPSLAVRVVGPDAQPVDCPRQKQAAGPDAFVCSIPDFDQLATLDVYKVYVTGDTLRVDPFPVRVYPSMRIPTRIGLDLTDQVFAADFGSSAAYYQAWQRATNNAGAPEFTRYLVARTYYSRAGDSINATTLQIARRWLDLAVLSAEATPFQGIDADVTGLWEQLPSRAQNDAERDVVARYSPPRLAGSTGASVQERLQASDWFLLRISLRAYVSEYGSRQQAFCRTMRIFQQAWTDSVERQKAIISEIWKFGTSNVSGLGANPQFARCASETAAPAP